METVVIGEEFFDDYFGVSGWVTPWGILVNLEKPDEYDVSDKWEREKEVVQS